MAPGSGDQHDWQKYPKVFFTGVTVQCSPTAGNKPSQGGRAWGKLFLHQSSPWGAPCASLGPGWLTGFMKKALGSGKWGVEQGWAWLAPKGLLILAISPSRLLPGSAQNVWMWHLRPWVSGDHGGAAGLAILKAFSSHNDFVTDSRSCDFRFLDSLGCRDGSWGTHPAAPHNKQPHKPHKSHSCCNPWLPGHHQSLPVPFRPNTLGESVELGGHPGGHPHPVPTGMWPGSTNPIPWAHPVLSPALASPALQTG